MVPYPSGILIKIRDNICLSRPLVRLCLNKRITNQQIA